jgi:hypothetical protein
MGQAFGMIDVFERRLPLPAQWSVIRFYFYCPTVFNRDQHAAVSAAEGTVRFYDSVSNHNFSPNTVIVPLLCPFPPYTCFLFPCNDCQQKLLRQSVFGLAMTGIVSLRGD